MDWNQAHLRHVGTIFRRGTNPAAAVYDSIGDSFPLAFDDGWLNLGLWEDVTGPDDEASRAVRALVEVLAARLPRSGTIVDVGNGLGAQDEVIAEVTQATRLVPVNITLSQLRAGRSRWEEAGAHAVLGDACQLPFADDSVDGLISVEAAFHFPSRRRFFDEAYRVLRPGGVMATSDVPVERMPRGPIEALAGVSQLRFWGLHRGAAVGATAIAGYARTAGFIDVQVERCGDRTIDPAMRWVRRHLPTDPGLNRGQRMAGQALISQVEMLRRRGMLDYILLWAQKPSGGVR